MEAGALVSSESTLAPLAASRLTARLWLGGIVTLSFVLRAAASIGHTTPRYFPDEYIYAELGRSIGTHGRPLVRGVPAHFPALLEPILAAPLWALAPLDAAYRLVQLENALAVSLAAIPAYLLARELRLSERYALLCAVFALAVPDLVYSTYVVADPIAYPLVLASLYAGHVALTRGGRRSEIAFLVLAALATAARLQYVVLFVAFAVAAFALERRRAPRAHPIFASALAACAAGVLALGPPRLLGYYSGALHRHIGLSTLTWALTDLFLLALVSGAILVPGAVAGLLRPRGRAETAFSLLVAGFAAATLAEAALYASNGSPRFQERYLFTLLPLLPIAFGLHARRVRPGRLPQLLVAAAVVVALPRLPLSGYAAGMGDTDSPFLAAVVRLADYLGTAGASIVVAAVTTLAVLLGLAPRLRTRAGAAVAIAAALAALSSVAATTQDLGSSRAVRAVYLAPNPSWVDALHLHDVAAVQTPGAPPWFVLDQLFWNTSVTHELVLGGATPSDLFATTLVRVGRDGSLRTARGVVRSPLLLQDYAMSATFRGAVRVAHANSYTVWKPTGTPRFGVAAFGRYWDGWLAWSGEVTVWPSASGRTRGTLSLTLSLPRHVRLADGRPVVVRFGRRRVSLAPGRRARLTFFLDGRGPQTVEFTTSGGGYSADLRKLSVRSTMPVFVPARTGGPAGSRR